jgi:hypothetical protein
VAQDVKCDAVKAKSEAGVKPASTPRVVTLQRRTPYPVCVRDVPPESESVFGPKGTERMLLPLVIFVLRWRLFAPSIATYKTHSSKVEFGALCFNLISVIHG